MRRQRLGSFHVGKAGVASSAATWFVAAASLLPASHLVEMVQRLLLDHDELPRERLAVVMASPARLLSVQRRIRWLPHILSERSRLKCFRLRCGIVAMAPVDVVEAA